MSYGDPLPERVTRAIALARLANFLGGHAAVRSEVAAAVADMLNRGPLPVVPAQSNGGAGEILALGTLFYELSGRLELFPKERMALINGSPCAAALIADTALAGRARLAVAEQVFALVADITGAPQEHYAPDLEELWGDEHEAAALASLRSLLGDRSGRQQSHQASVSLRILPRVLGASRRAQSLAESAATVSLSSVTDNPVFLPPSDNHPDGEIYSTGRLSQRPGRARDRCAGDSPTPIYVSSANDSATISFSTPASRRCWEATNGQSSRCTWRSPDGPRRPAPPLRRRCSHSDHSDRTTCRNCRSWPGAKPRRSRNVSTEPSPGWPSWRPRRFTSRGVRDRPALRGLIETVRSFVAPVDQPRPIGSECQRLYEWLTESAVGRGR